MKNDKSSQPLARRLTRLVIASTLCFAFSLPLTAAADTHAAKVDPNAPYQYFTGLNLSVTYDNGECPVVDYRGRSAILWAKGKTVGLHMAQLAQLHFTSSPKLSRTVVNIVDFKTTAIAKPGTSESENMLKIMSVQNMAEDARGIAMGNALTSGMAGLSSGSGTSATQAQLMDKAAKPSQNDQNQGMLKAAGADYGPGQHMNAGMDAQKTVKDTLDVSFTVSSKEPVDNAYAFILALVKAPGADKSVTPWVHFERLDRIDGTPKEVHFQQPGLPPDFELLGTSVFVFAHGEEIANSMSNHLASASIDEARALINKDYITEHAGMNLPPRIATFSIPDSMATRLQQDGVTPNLVLHLDENANITAAECDGKAVSPDALALLQTLVFHPGLKNGAAIASSAHLNVYQFSTSNLEKMTHL